ncbi:MAG TPA: ABC transporter ATP-binding protein [Steroidobacteraceae bacterium]|nr:ABC transporter ATP-binding protein [Steroidobacteraceae bacterium]
MSISLDQVTKRYQGSTVVNDVSIDIGDGEFFVLLGPSGSGKSTLLRAVAGLTGVDHGRISLHGRDVTHLAARRRGVGLVFQNYALFRHMTVADNIEFALRVRRMRAAARRARRNELLRLVALEGLDDRLPAQLSGGQQQRVAVARALAHKPEVLLLDEPFGALDAKIREELRRTIRQVQRELGITTVLVTHDQEEAFALADRIGIMNLGRLLEVGRPDDLYARPATRFVATFLGAANLLLARQSADGLSFGNGPLIVPHHEPSSHGRAHEVVTVLRPEEIELAPARDALRSPYMAEGTVEEILFSGALERLRVRLGDGLAGAHIVRSENLSEEPYLEVTRTQHEQRVFPLAPGLPVALGVRRLHVLPTPLSSFVAWAPTAALAETLAREPLLAELATRMKTRIAIRVEPALAESAPLPEGAVALRDSEAEETDADFSGAAVIRGSNDARAVEWLLARGVDEVLILRAGAAAPRRVLIHWVNESARRATLAVSASLLRHLSAEAVYVGILPEHERADAPRPLGMRALLDARSEAAADHGLDMRTELGYGDVAQELALRLAESPDQLLILGISDAADLGGRFAELLTNPASPLLIVYRRSELQAVPAPLESSSRAASGRLRYA